MSDDPEARIARLKQRLVDAASTDDDHLIAAEVRRILWEDLHGD